MKELDKLGSLLINSIGGELFLLSEEFMFDFLWEGLQSSSIAQANWNADDAKHLATRAENETTRFEHRLTQLEKQNERLSLAIMALAEILSAQPSITNDLIEAKMREIDLRDGKLDGKLQRPAKLCGSCQRTSNAHRTACLYCGERLPQDSVLFSPSSS